MLVELKHLIEGVKVSVRQAVFVLLCVMVGDSALLMTAAAYLVFPIPFTSLVMVPPLLAIVAVALRVSFGSDGFKKMLEHPAQLYGFVLFIFAQALTLIVYPIYQVLFSASVNTHFELSVMMLLPIVKMMTKNITSLIQNKLIVWMLLTLTCRVVHYGFDFTFQFSWIKSS
ncbi:hypothetical protein PF006_g3574 [Phytophthora fragariae]|uniref:Ig-like domain-containing protein n=1 Tax=Phytophthora fragariae TaxID=53985 RepID=A0A6A3UNG1_9STRA|nr:hypothetical protein PF006_g3574 [Phytophthora fragariae]